MNGTKVCNKCREPKPLDGFHRYSKARDGRHSICKTCRNLANAPQARQWARDNPERTKENGRRYRDANREEIRIRNREHCRKWRAKMKALASARPQESCEP